jgi:rod shape-determining protein MreD
VTFGAGALIRVVPLVVLAVVLQIAGLAQMHLFGGTFDLVPLVVAAVAFYAGSMPGSIVGFSAGLLLDMALGQNLGLSSLILTAVGYLVGRFREVRDPAHGLLPIAVGAAATAGYAAGFAGLSFMLEIEASVSAEIFRSMLVTIWLNALVALPVFWLVRKLLRPVLLYDPMERRRRREPLSTGPIGLRGLGV